MRRKHISRRKSRRIFSRTAQKIHKMNLPRVISRGGFEL